MGNTVGWTQVEIIHHAHTICDGVRGVGSSWECSRSSLKENPNRRVVCCSTEGKPRNLCKCRIAQTGNGCKWWFQSFEACSRASDSSTRRIVDANPDIVIVEIRDSSERGCRRFRCSRRPLPKVASPDHLQCHGTRKLIIEAMRSRRPGNTCRIRFFLSQATLLEAFHRYLVEQKFATTRRGLLRNGGKAILHHFGEKHGSGATTLAVNLAGIYRGPIEPNRQGPCWTLDRPVGDAAGLSEHQACIHGKRRTCGGPPSGLGSAGKANMQKTQRILPACWIP